MISQWQPKETAPKDKRQMIEDPPLGHKAHKETNMTERIIAEIAAERRQQIDIEGLSNGELAEAAATYAHHAALNDRMRSYARGTVPGNWPLPARWWKPTNRRRDLIRAAAMIVAEIERIDRASGGKHETTKP